MPDLDLDVVSARALEWPDTVRGFAVTDEATYRRAAEYLTRIKALQDEVDAAFDPIIASAHKAHRTAVDQKRKVEEPLISAELAVKAALVAYDDEQERIRRERQRLADDAARRRDEDERLARAATMEIEGREFGDPALVEEAHALLARPAAPPPAPAIAKATPKIAGQHFTTSWTAEVVDLAALVQWVAKHPAYLPLLAVNQSAINAQARSLKGALAIPGVRAVPTKSLAARS